MGDTCTLVADSCECMAKTTTICKVINLQLKSINKLIKKKKRNTEEGCHALLQGISDPGIRPTCPGSPALQ